MAIIKIRNAAIDLDAAEIPNLPATKITSGTFDNARISLDAAEIPNLNASKITAGTVAAARLGSGTANATTFLRGDNTFAEAGGGSLVKIAATTVSSNVSTVDFTSAFTNTYSVYKIIIKGARPDTTNNAIAMRFGSGTSFDTGSNYERVVIASGLSNSSDSVDARYSTTADISFSPMSSQSNAAETSCNMELTIYNMLDSAKNTYVTCVGAFEGASAEFRMLFGSFNYNQTNVRNSVRFFNTSGNNIATGTFTIYGVIT